MRIKRCLALLLGAAAALSLCACAGAGPDMSVQPAQLTQEESNLVKLLDVGMEDFHIYDFTVSDKVQSIQINAYELEDGAWSMVVGGGGHAFTDPKGRLALRFGKLTEGMSVALQGESSSGGVSHHTEPEEGGGPMSFATSTLTRSMPVVYEEEIPLVIQVATTQSEIRTFDVEYFSRPEEYEKFNYEHVYAVTVRFSEKPLSELSGSAPPETTNVD